MTDASTNERLLLNKIFFPTAIKDWEEHYNSENLHFVHYTSAEAFSSILEHEEIWLRDVRAMNDTQEVKYGYDMIKETMQKENIKEKMTEAFVACGEDVAKSASNAIDFFLKEGFESFLTEVFVACLAEHQSFEDDHGRLSMWRGYNKGGTGVAIILNKNIMDEDTILPVFLSGVDYIDRNETEEKIEEIVNNIHKNSQKLSTIHQRMLRKGQQSGICADLIRALIFAPICIKHPGFSEEKEWRIIHMPEFQYEEELPKKHQCINGTIQKIYTIPLDKDTAEKTGMSLDSIIDKVIIGPCKFPDVTKEGIISLMKEKGILDAEKRVVISGIPLRPE